MNIYWCGGEDIDFPGLSLTTSWDYARTGYARVTLGRSSVGNGPPFAVGELTSCFVSARHGHYGTDLKLFGLVKNGSGGKGYYIGTGDGANNRAALWKYDGSSWTKLGQEAGTSFGSDPRYIRPVLQIEDYGSSGTVRFLIDGVAVVEYTGDLTISGVTGFDAFGFGGGGHNCSEIIVSDQESSTLSLVTLYPNAAGDANAWTGDHTGIDEEVISDADTVYVDSAAQDAQFNLSATPAGSFAVDAIKIVARACKTGDAAVGTVALGVKSGGTVDVDAGHALTTAWKTYERLTPTVNGAQLTTALLDALQLNLRSAA